MSYLRGDISGAAKLLAGCATFYEKWKVVETFGQPYQAIQFQRVMAAAVQYRQEPLFEAAWQEGEALTLEQAIDLALAC